MDGRLASPRRVAGAADDPDYVAFCRAFKLNPAKRTFDLTTDKLDPLLAGTPETGAEVLDLETRSLIQVLFFVSNGVSVPPGHPASGAAAVTADPSGAGFDWDQVLGGLFKVCWSTGMSPPASARVAVRYRGH